MDFCDAKDFLNLIEFCPTNLTVYNSIYDSVKKNNLSPFVGAGFSAFAYPQWGELFSNTLIPAIRAIGISDEEISEIEESVNKGEYTYAAERISKMLTSPLFLMILKDEFSELKLNDKNFENESIGYLVKAIKNNLYYTTNYDHIIENAFLTINRSQIKVLSNSNYVDLEAFFRNRTPVLFKIHGDIDAPADDIILTESSYEKQYGDSSEFVSILSENIKKNVLLFLGTSFSDSFLVNILKKPIFPQGSNINPNLAIVGVRDKTEILPLNKKLGEMNITSIFYNINSIESHSWVSKILNWLKKGVHPEKKEDLIKVVNKNPYESIFAPFNAKTKFCDNKNQIAPLINFLNAKTRFVWWELSGISGSGKTRYAIELAEFARQIGWEVNYYSLKNIQDIKLNSSRLASDSLYIFDDADYYDLKDSRIATVDDLSFFTFESKILKLMDDDLSNNKKVRILFIYSNSDKGKNKAWWNGIKTTSYRFEQSQFKIDNSCIIEINKDDIIAIIKSFAIENYHKAIPDNIIEIILNAFNNLEILIGFPLIAMILVEAYFTDKPEGQFCEYAISRLAELEKARAKSDGSDVIVNYETVEMQKIIPKLINEIFKEKLINYNTEDSPKFNLEGNNSNNNSSENSSINKINKE